jgi:hypothetical protein
MEQTATNGLNPVVVALVRDLWAALADGVSPSHLHAMLRLRNRRTIGMVDAAARAVRDINTTVDEIISTCQAVVRAEADAAADTAVGNLIKGRGDGDACDGNMVLSAAQRKVVLYGALHAQVREAVEESTGDEDLRVVDVKCSRN